MGGHSCSPRPCDLSAQQFYHLEDDFPVPWPPGLQPILQPGQGSLACKKCTSGHHNALDPDGETPVQYYPPTIGLDVTKVDSTSCSQSVDKSMDDDKEYDYDYKALSSADSDEWLLEQEEPDQSTEPSSVHDDITDRTHGDLVNAQLKELPTYLAHQQSFVPFVQPGPAPGLYAMGHYPHQPMPHTEHPTPAAIFNPPYWHGSMSPFYPGPPNFLASYADSSSLQLGRSLVQEAAASAGVALHPATPPLTPPVGPKDSYPSRTVPPFIVGTVTDAFLRIEAARERHMREGTRRRTKKSPRGTPPTRRMALTEFVVEKGIGRAPSKDTATSEVLETDTGSSLPVVDEDWETERETEEDSKLLEDA